MDNIDFDYRVSFSQEQLLDMLEDNDTLCLDSAADRAVLAKAIRSWLVENIDERE